jgi:hypothetical protein
VRCPSEIKPSFQVKLLYAEVRRARIHSFTNNQSIRREIISDRNRLR